MFHVKQFVAIETTRGDNQLVYRFITLLPGREAHCRAFAQQLAANFARRYPCRTFECSRDDKRSLQRATRGF